jgi:uncharacterized protein (DUF2344 family)
MNKDRLTKAQDLIKRVDISNQSVLWWEDKIMEIMAELDIIEESTKKKDKRRMLELVSQLQSLLPRGRLEIDTIDKLEEEVQEFIKHEKETKPNPKKSTGK